MGKEVVEMRTRNHLSESNDCSYNKVSSSCGLFVLVIVATLKNVVSPMKDYLSIILSRVSELVTVRVCVFELVDVSVDTRIE